MCCTTHWLKCLQERVTSSAWSSTWCCCLFFDSLFLALFLSVCFSYPFFFYLNTDLYHFLVVVAKAIRPCASTKSGYEPSLPGDFHYSETTEIFFFFRDESSDAEPSYLCDAELDDETIGKELSSPLFIQEREEPADRRQADHSFEESLLPAQSFSVCHSRTERPVQNLVR